MRPIKRENLDALYAEYLKMPENEETSMELRDELKDYTVVTNWAWDTQIYETSIHPNWTDIRWVVVARYPDKETAEYWHNQWVAFCKKTKPLTLWSVDTDAFETLP